MLMECKAVVFIPSICSPFFYVSLTIFLIRGKTPLPSYKFMSFGGVAPSRFQKWASEPDFIDRDMSYPYHSFWSRNRHKIQEGSMKMNPRTLTGMTPKRPLWFHKTVCDRNEVNLDVPEAWGWCQHRARKAKRWRENIIKKSRVFPLWLSGNKSD